MTLRKRITLSLPCYPLPVSFPLRPHLLLFLPFTRGVALPMTEDVSSLLVERRDEERREVERSDEERSYTSSFRLFFPRKQKVETKFPMNDVSLGHRRLILRPTPAAAGRAGRPGPLITVPQRLHVEKLLPGMGAQAFVEEQAPPFRSEDKRRIEKRCSRRGHSSCRGLRPKRRVVGGK